MWCIGENGLSRNCKGLFAAQHLFGQGLGGAACGLACFGQWQAVYAENVAGHGVAVEAFAAEGRDALRAVRFGFVEQRDGLAPARIGHVRQQAGKGKASELRLERLDLQRPSARAKHVVAAPPDSVVAFYRYFRHDALHHPVTAN